MKSKMKAKELIAFFIIFAIILSSLTACAGETDKKYYTSIQQLDGNIIAAITGSNTYLALQEAIPNAELPSYNTVSEMIIALADRQIDGFAQPKCKANMIKESLGTIDYLRDFSINTDYAFAFAKNAKGRQYKKEFNQFLAQLKSSGKLEKMKQEWMQDIEQHALPDKINTWDCAKGTIELCVSNSAEPFSYTYKGEFSGYEIALVSEFCKEHSYKLSITNKDYDVMLNDLSNGLCDMAAGGIEITHRRIKELSCSDAIFTDEGVVYVLADPEKKPSYTSLDQLDGLTYGIEAGSIAEYLGKERFPNSVQLAYPSFPDCAAALSVGKIDFYLHDDDPARVMVQEHEGFAIIEEALGKQPIGAIFAKDSERSDFIRSQFNEFLQKKNESGELETLKQDWIYHYNTKRTTDIKLDPNAEPLYVAFNFIGAPYNFVVDNTFDGFETEIVKLFCQEYGYYPMFSIIDFTGIIPAVVSGKVDMALADLSITEERAKNVNFSEPYAYSSTVAIVRQETQSLSILDRISSSIYNNLLLESRWKLVINGVLTTLGITISSAIIGSAIGFVIYLACRRHKKHLFAAINFLSRLVGALPMVIVLMILYYVILAKSSIPSFIVAIIGFSFSMSLVVFSLLCRAVDSIDPGQTEGAYSVGLTEEQAFFKVVLPQALMQFMPNYKDALVSLVQGTAIVGYIAVEDITKVSDIIRSRTYEAFFPLIFTALVYIALGSFLSALVRSVKFKIDPRTRSKEKILENFK